MVQDRYEAARLWQLAADQRHPNALHWLGICHLQGQGVRKDLSLGKSLLQAAADRGVNAAMDLINKTGVD